MPALVDTLESTFTSGGFSLQSVTDGLSSAATAITPQGASLDQNALGQIGQRLAHTAFDQVTAAVSAVGSQSGDAAASFPHPDALLEPLTGALASTATLVNTDPHAVLAQFEQAAASGDGALGMDALAGPLSALASVRSNEPAATVLRLLTAAVPGGLPVAQTISHFGVQAAGIEALVRLLGALMSTEALTREMVSAVELVAGMLDGPTAEGAVAQLQAAGAQNGADLAALVADAAPDDPDQVAAVVARVTGFADAVRDSAGRIVSGMAFGEATLVGADFAALSDGVTQAGRLLDEAALDHVHALATQAAAWIAPILRVDLGAPATSLDVFVSQLAGLLAQLAGAIDAIDPAVIAGPVNRALVSVLAPLQQLEAVAHQVSATIRSALQTAQQAIASVDLRPVTEAIHAAVQPIVDALHDLDQLIGAAQTELQSLATTLTTALTTLRHTLDGAAQAIHDALGGVASTIEELHLDQLQATITSDLQPVANTLHAAQVKPYFDTAIQALNVVGSTVSAVPVSLLPDDARQELAGVVQPIQDIDFDTDVRQVLEGQLDTILTSFSTDVLDEVEQAYQQVVAFIASIDPRPPLQQFEQADFDPMLARIRAVDPTEILKPVSDVIAEMKSSVSAIDLRQIALTPLERVFDQLAHAFDQIDPSALLAPVEQQVGDLRDRITRALDLPQLQAWLARIDPFVAQLLARLDVNALITLLDAAWAQLRPSPAAPGPSALGTVVAGLLEGTGLTLRMDSFAAIVNWVSGADAAGEINARLAAAASAVDDAVKAVQRVDPQALVAATQPSYAALSAAVDALPAGSTLRAQLEPVIAGASPLELLGTTVDNRARYLSALTALQTSLHALAASARSELTAIAQGLRTALRPLTVIPDRIRVALARIGLDVANKSLRDLVDELFDQLPPSRLLAPLAPALTGLGAKVAALVHNVVVAPLASALSSITDALAALDISFIRTGLQSLHDQIAADIAQLRPSVLLADVLNAFDATKATIAAFDPLAPVRTAIDAMKSAIDDVANHYRPTVLFAPVLDLHDQIAHALGTLDVKGLLDPVLKALDNIKKQLDTGLDGTATALTGLQRALGSLAGSGT